MERYVVTILDEVCTKNEKTKAMQADLVLKLKEYGTVEPYDEHIAKHNAQWQKTVDGIVAEHDKVKAVACNNSFEFAVLRACRVAVDDAVSAVNAEKDKYREELENNKEKLELLKANITAVLGN
jgi:hypothetical protein